MYTACLTALLSLLCLQGGDFGAIYTKATRVAAEAVGMVVMPVIEVGYTAILVNFKSLHLVM
jgi:hypothetical protein